jgi:competence protein ComEA
MKSNRLSLIALMVLVLLLTAGAGAIAETPGKSQAAPQSGKQVLKGKTVNINKVTAEDLVKNVPLITPELAKRIVQYRKENGDFQTLEELLQVEGFSRDLLRRIKTFLLLEGVGGKDCTC